jgi:carboxylesterase type B
MEFKVCVLFILNYFYLNNLIEANDEITVTIKPKQFNGLKKTIDGNEIDYFLGIPYAEPPIGKLRFKRPKPIKYEKPINATEWPNVCQQNSDLNLFTTHNMSEDCLYLNIWTPKIGSQLKPVMVFIHGGALVGGSSSIDLYNGEVLASRGDVVVVTFNYRVQALGFLYTGSDDAPGNVGLWDQALALQWVRDNIANFGGDPEQVTIFGESAGSWSVGLHILSPITRNLFKYAIMMSAGPLSHLTGENPTTAKSNWLKVAKLVECGDGLNFSTTAIECLMNISAEKLVKMADRKDLTTDPSGYMSQVRYGDEFLPKKPKDMLLSGDYKKNLKLMAGFTNDEGSWVLADRIDPIKYSHKNPSNLTKSQAYEELKTLSHRLITPYHSVNGDDVAKLYLSRLPNNDYDSIRRTMGVALGDFYITCTTMLFAKFLYENDKTQTKVYQYYFTAKQSFLEAIGYCSKWQGACHVSDLVPAFGLPLRLPQNSSTIEEKELSKKMIETFAHFARKGSEYKIRFL